MITDNEGHEGKDNLWGVCGELFTMITKKGECFDERREWDSCVGVNEGRNKEGSQSRVFFDEGWLRRKNQ